ncbi:hypothetical protein CCACVL1_25204, partial [Corchorus capsularis]
VGFLLLLVRGQGFQIERVGRGTGVSSRGASD